MITHDVDEAILLSDKIMLMSNGPNARIAEIVENTLPKNRERATMHHDPMYYPMRNHLVDFLVHRSKLVQQSFAAPILSDVLGSQRDDFALGSTWDRGAW